MHNLVKVDYNLFIALLKSRIFVWTDLTFEKLLDNSHKLSNMEYMIKFLDYEKYLQSIDIRYDDASKDGIIMIIKYDGGIDISYDLVERFLGKEICRQMHFFGNTFTFRLQQFKQDFYEKFPNLINNDAKELKDKIDTLTKKIDTMAQYQGALIDKINVFAEMIDSFEKK